MNLVSTLLAHAADRPDSAAIVDGDGVVTYAELQARAARVAGAIAQLNVDPGDRVAIVSGTDLDFVETYLGVLWAGAVAVPLNPQTPVVALATEIEKVGASVVVLGSTAHYLGSLPGAHALDDLPAADPMSAEAERDDSELAVLLYTSGTAGAPRAAMLTHGNLASNIGQVQGHSGLRVGIDDVGLAALPFFHVFGLNVSLGLGLAGGTTTVLLEKLDVQRALELIREHRVTVLTGVPTMYSAILALSEDEAPSDSFASVRLAVCGASALQRDNAERFQERFGLTIFEGYGLTEASPIVTTTAVVDIPHWGSIGPPLPGVQVRLVSEDGTDALVGDPGEIWVKGPNVFAGYWNDREATDRVLQDGWLHTGDIAVADNHGYLALVDRVKDLIIVSGFNVYPAEVEDVIRMHADVIDVGVFGVTNARTGEEVVAWVVVRPGSELDHDDIRDHALLHLARYKAPRSVEFVESLPRDTAGKLLRRELRTTPR